MHLCIAKFTCLSLLYTCITCIYAYKWSCTIKYTIICKKYTCKYSYSQNMKGANFAYDAMSWAYACALACAIVAGAVVICTCNRHQFHEHVEYIQHMHIYAYMMHACKWQFGMLVYNGHKCSKTCGRSFQCKIDREGWQQVSMLKSCDAGNWWNQHVAPFLPSWALLAQSTISTAKPLTHKDYGHFALPLLK